MTIQTYGDAFTLATNVTGGARLAALANGNFAIALYQLPSVGVGVFDSVALGGGTLNFAGAFTLPLDYNTLALEALTDGRFLVAFVTNSGTNDVTARAYSITGASFGDYFVASSGTGSETNPFITPLAGGNFAVGWQNGGNDFLTRVFGADGTPTVPSFNYTAANLATDTLGTSEPLADGTVLNFHRSLAGGVAIVQGVRIDPYASTQIGGFSTLSDGSSSPVGTAAGQLQSARLASGELVVIWLGTTGVLHGRLVAQDGTPLGAVLTLATAVESVDDVTFLIDGGFVVGFSRFTAGSNSAHIRQFNAQGAPIDVEQSMPGSTNGYGVSLVTLADGRLVAGWTELDAATGHRARAQMFDPRGDRLIAAASSFDDRWAGTGVSDFLLLGAGNDTASGGAGQDYLYGEGGNDTLFGHQVAIGSDDNAIDVLFGGAGDDLLSGLGGPDQMFGEFGADTLHGGQGDDYLDGGPGNDVIFGNNGSDAIAGRDGNDTIDTGTGANAVSAGAGDDMVTGGSQADLLDGEEGDDTLSGGGSADVLIGRDGRDILDGGDGNDTLNGGPGSDLRLEGGAGDDVVDGEEGDDLIWGDDDVGGVTSAALSDGSDTLVGRDGDDTIHGQGGADIISGGNGNDTLTGGNGNDAMEGGNGNDQLRGGTGADVLWGDRDPASSATDNDDFQFQFADLQGGVNDYIVDFGNDIAGNTDRITLSGIAAGNYVVSKVGSDAVISINLGAGAIATITVIGQTAAGITDDIFT